MRPMATTRVKVITWILRVVALVALIVLFAVSIHQFYAAYDPSTVKTIYIYILCALSLTMKFIFRFVLTVNICLVYLSTTGAIQSTKLFNNKRKVFILKDQIKRRFRLVRRQKNDLKVIRFFKAPTSEWYKYSNINKPCYSLLFHTLSFS